ncbi:hypothetical protein BZZ01_08095 [Nostocales cyanobacterium HT-58-2]|nr:hypothetical protein BZZ01_08095 [Nostocales cyanobacterium HT-58-2]
MARKRYSYIGASVLLTLLSPTPVFSDAPPHIIEQQLRSLERDKNFTEEIGGKSQVSSEKKPDRVQGNYDASSKKNGTRYGDTRERGSTPAGKNNPSSGVLSSETQNGSPNKSGVSSGTGQLSKPFVQERQASEGKNNPSSRVLSNETQNGSPNKSGVSSGTGQLSKPFVQERQASEGKNNPSSRVLSNETQNGSPNKSGVSSGTGQFSKPSVQERQASEGKNNPSSGVLSSETQNGSPNKSGVSSGTGQFSKPSVQERQASEGKNNPSSGVLSSETQNGSPNKSGVSSETGQLSKPSVQEYKASEGKNNPSSGVLSGATQNGSPNKSGVSSGTGQITQLPSIAGDNNAPLVKKSDSGELTPSSVDKIKDDQIPSSNEPQENRKNVPAVVNSNGSSNSLNSFFKSPFGLWLLWLLPLAILGLLLWWFWRRRPSSSAQQQDRPESPNFVDSTPQIPLTPNPLVSPDVISPNNEVEQGLVSPELESESEPVSIDTGADELSPSFTTNAQSQTEDIENNISAPVVSSAQAVSSDAEMEDAYRLVNLGEHEAALARFRTLTSTYPERVDGWIGQGQTLLNLQNFEDALASFSQAIHLSSIVPVAAWLGRGEALVALDRPQEALTDFEQAIASNIVGGGIFLAGAALATKALLGKGKALQQLGRTQEALANFDQATDVTPDDPSAWMLKAETLLHLQQPEAALAIFKRVTQLAPNYLPGWVSQGNTLASLGRFEQAVAQFEQALNIQPDLTNAWVGRGKALVKLNRLNDALASFERALILQPDAPDILTAKGNVLVNLGRVDEGIACLNHALNRNSNNPVIWIDRGNALIKLKRHEEALASFEQSINLKSDHPQSWLGKGNALLSLGRPAEAVSSFERTIELTTMTATGGILFGGAVLLAKAWAERGHALLRLERSEAAIASFERATEVNPNDAQLWMSRGKALAQLNQTQQALLCFDQVIVLNPQLMEGWLGKGQALLNLNHSEEALPCFNSAITLNHDAPDSWIGKGNALINLGQVEEALPCFERVVELNPQSQEGWKGQGYVLVSLGQSQAAQSSFERAIAINPRDVQSWVGKGSALVVSGKAQEALSSFEQAIELDPNNASVWLNRANVLIILNRFQDAISDLDRALESRVPESPLIWVTTTSGIILLERTELLANIQTTKEDVLSRLRQTEVEQPTSDETATVQLDPAQIWVQRGDELSRQQQIDAALDSYEQAITLEPNLLDAWIGKGINLIQLGDANEALVCFDQAIEIFEDNHLAWIGRGSAFNFLGEYEDAIFCFEQVHELNPDSTLAWLGKGYAWLGLSILTDTLTNFEQVIERQPDLPQAWLGKAYTLLALHQFDEAIISFERALELSSTQTDMRSVELILTIVAPSIKVVTPYAWVGKGTALVNLDNIEDALENYDRAIATAQVAKVNVPACKHRESIVTGQVFIQEDAINGFTVALEQVIYSTLEYAAYYKLKPGRIYIQDCLSDELSKLYTLHLTTGKATFIAEIATKLTDIAFVGTQLYGLNQISNSTQLIEIDINTGYTTVIGNIGFAVLGLAYNRQDHTLFTTTAKQLIAINLETGQGTPVLTLANQDYNCGEIAFDGDGKAYITLIDNDKKKLLASCNLNTGEVNVIGNIGFANIASMEFVGDVLYGVTGNFFNLGEDGQLIRIDITTGQGTLMTITDPIGRWSGICVYEPIQEVTTTITPNINLEAQSQKVKEEETSPATSEAIAQVIRVLTIDTKDNCYVINPGEMNNLQHNVANFFTLYKGTFDIRITSGNYNYAQSKTAGEPFVLLWIYGVNNSRFINKNTGFEIGATWTTLNGYDNSLQLEVQDQTVLCALFFDVNNTDNSGRVHLSITSNSSYFTPQELIVDSKSNCYILDENYLSSLQQWGSNFIPLGPGKYRLKIQHNSYASYWSDNQKFDIEAWALIRIKGGKFITKMTGIEVEQTWCSLNGFKDEVVLEVKEETTLSGFFFDTYKEDNQGKIYLTIESILENSMTVNRVNSHVTTIVDNGSSIVRQRKNLDLSEVAVYELKVWADARCNDDEIKDVMEGIKNRILQDKNNLNQVLKKEFIYTLWKHEKLPKISNTWGRRVKVNIEAEGQWNYGTSYHKGETQKDPNIDRFVDGDGNQDMIQLENQESDMLFHGVRGLEENNIPPAALIAFKIQDKNQLGEFEPDKFEFQYLSHGKNQQLELEPHETVYFINNDEPGFYDDNSEYLTLRYCIV